MISKHYDGSLIGHCGHNKTIELIQQNYQFPNMRKAVEEYIKQYITWAQNKPARHKPYGKQQQIEVP